MTISTPPGEVTLFSDSNALVSTTRVILNGTTYPLSNVSSVRMLTKRPGHAITAVVLLFALVLFFAAHSIIFGLLVLAIAATLAFARKPQHTVVIGSSGGEKSAFTSKDEKHIQSLVGFINEAIISRG